MSKNRKWTKNIPTINFSSLHLNSAYYVKTRHHTSIEKYILYGTL